jgi:hypothetical protein
VTRHVKLRHHADAALSRVSDNLASLILGIEQTIGTQLMELRKLFALDPKTLVLSQMPVKHIELDGRHAIEVPLQNLHRLIMAAYVDQQAAPSEARLISDGDFG